MFVLLLCAGALQAQQTFGYVLDLRGDWTLNGGAKLSKGSSLSVGGVITAANPSDSSSYIVVANRSGNIFEKRNCSNAGECNKAIQLPRAIENQQSLTTRLIGAAMALVSNEPGKYASFVSRGAELQEAVIKLSDQKLDLSPVFKNMQGDKYLVRFEKIGKDKKSVAQPLKPVPFIWDSKKPEPLVAGEIGPGLYRVSILDVSLLEPDGTNESTGNEAWVLITAPTDYAKAAPSFDDAVKMTRQWGPNVKPNAVRSFLRASLEFITTQSTK
ncbi:MAG: hypothetical protein WBP93_23670 [Pyrinomonadaceae bacterium]